ncbi:MAG: hypothetical protein QOJ03_294 [Frankiaceae bacterium]|jgi:pimeloyl-ACP methyl ester carboxylesterase|nr:hypothetical protein [Frankiaceae bacterium]
MKKVTTLVGVGLAIATLFVGMPVAASTSGPARAPVATISWRPCHSLFGAQCGFISVPLNYAHPNRKHIKIAVSRVRHTSSAGAYKGVILVNPGGPGAPGRSYATLGQDVPKHVGDDYDWIGFDPRGVGASRPALRCVHDYFHVNRPDYRPRTSALLHKWKHRSRHYAQRCAAKHPALIRHMTTAETARDMDQIRLALGVDRISFYGFSYGTYLGQVYATLFPNHLRRMVLDSTVDPRRVWYGANLDQDIAFDRNITTWFKWVAKYHAHYHVGATEKAVEHRWYAILDQLAAHPAGGKVGPDEWTDTFLWAGYYRSTWKTLGHDFSRYVHGGHWRAVADFYAFYNSPGDDNGYAVYLAVECTDAPWPQRWSRWQSDGDRVYAKAPFLTWDNAWFNAPCLYWKAPARKPVHISGSSTQSVLLIDETHDAATPFEGSLEVRRRFLRSSLISEPGGGTHADSLSGDDCVDNRIADYLRSGKRPARKSGDRADYRCAPLPDPVP